MCTAGPPNDTKPRSHVRRTTVMMLARVEVVDFCWKEVDSRSSSYEGTRVLDSAGVATVAIFCAGSEGRESCPRRDARVVGI